MSQIQQSAQSAATPLLSAEHSLGQRLNQAVQQGRRADFSYLLASLSDNVLEFSAFAPLNPASKTPWRPPFAYGPAVPLAVQPREFTQQPSHDFSTSRVLWRLQHAMHPAGLHIVNDKHHLGADVVANCAHYVQQRLASQQTEVLPTQTQHTAADGLEDDAPGPADLIDIIDKLRGIDRAVA